MRILITGITGQDGSILAELLIGHEVHGIVRRSSCDNTIRLNSVKDRVVLHHGDVADPISIASVINEVRPERIFNMADQDEVPFSHATPAYSADITAGSVMRLLEIVRRVVPTCHVFQPISSTIFGDAPPTQDETTELNPLSPYAVCKTAALYTCRLYRQVHGMSISCGIMFNHDSPRRKPGYLIDSICSQAAQCAIGGKYEEAMIFNNLSTRVDIGYAPEFMQLAVHLTSPGDFVFATGIAYTILELAEYAAELAGYPDCPVVERGKAERPGPVHELIGTSDKLASEIGAWPRIDAKDVIKIRMRSMT